MDLPVTLVIKAPNQRVEDQTVDCMLGWTVKKLKQHLTDVYPSKPNEQNQRLIYSGKLLADHLTLKEVLRQFDDDSNRHTVHLVCSGSPQADTKSHNTNTPLQSQSHSRQSSSSSTSSQHSNGSPSDISGLRHRGHRNPSPSTPVSPPTYSTNNPNVFQQYSAGMAMPNQIPAGFSVANQMPAAMGMTNQIPLGMGMANQMPAAAMGMANQMPAGMGMPNQMPAGMGYTPEQYMYMQQMYAQYMAQYMQYYQQGMYPVSQNAAQVPPPDQNVPPQNVLNNNNNQEVGGDMGEEFDDEFRQQDWLDYLYTFSRFMVLIGIVYYYSNMYRFLMVAGCVFLLYAFQMGWFHGRNNQRQQQQQNQQAQGAQQQQQQQQQQNQQQQQQQGTDQADGTDQTTPPEEQTPPREPEAPSKLQIVWTFVSTFFTSLFPSPPPAVNVN